jgi:hypothetical protein
LLLEDMLALRLRRERGSVSLSPISFAKRNRAVMVVRLPPDVGSVCPVADEKLNMHDG